MLVERFISRKISKSFTSALRLQKKLPEIDADVGIVLVQTQLLAYLVADDVVTLLLDILPDVLALQSEGIEAAVADFPIGEPLVLQEGRELGMVLLKENLGGAQELFPVSHHYV